MSNIKRTKRADPLTYTVDTGALTTTHGKMALAQADESTLGTDSRGAAVGDAHFPLVAYDSDDRPPRYLDVLHPAIGTSAGDTDALVYVGFWNCTEWTYAEPFRACGRTVIEAAAAADPAEYLPETHSVKVPRDAIAGRFYVTGLAANTGLDLTVQADNDD